MSFDLLIIMIGLCVIVNRVCLLVERTHYKEITLTEEDFSGEDAPNDAGNPV